MTDHSITPPPKLVARWKDNWLDAKIKHINLEDYILAQAAQWGWIQRLKDSEGELQKARDEELEACEKWVAVTISAPEAAELRAARRPKPPSLKELALAELAATERCHPADYSTIRKALEALPND